MSCVVTLVSGLVAMVGCDSPSAPVPTQAGAHKQTKPLAKPVVQAKAKPTPTTMHSDLPGADQLPEAAGKVLVLSACTTCHTPDLLASQRLTPEQWAGKVSKMQGWGAVVSPADAATMANYLATNFGPDVPDPELVRVPPPL